VASWSSSGDLTASTQESVEFGVNDKVIVSCIQGFSFTKDMVNDAFKTKETKLICSPVASTTTTTSTWAGPEPPPLPSDDMIGKFQFPVLFNKVAWHAEETQMEALTTNVCSPIECTPEIDAHGEYIYLSGSGLDEVWTLSCDQGYYPHLLNSMVAKCSQDGLSSSGPCVIDNGCNVSLIETSRFAGTTGSTCSGFMYDGMSCEVTCDTGYESVGKHMCSRTLLLGSSYCLPTSGTSQWDVQTLYHISAGVSYRMKMDHQMDNVDNMSSLSEALQAVVADAFEDSQDISFVLSSASFIQDTTSTTSPRISWFERN
jgi:hypothetical protein